MLTEGHHAYVIVRTGLLRGLPEKKMMDEAHKAQDNISISFSSSEPFVPSVNYDYASLDEVTYGILKDFALNPQKDVVKNGSSGWENDTVSGNIRGRVFCDGGTSDKTLLVRYGKRKRS